MSRTVVKERQCPGPQQKRERILSCSDCWFLSGLCNQAWNPTDSCLTGGRFHTTRQTARLARLSSATLGHSVFSTSARSSKHSPLFNYGLRLHSALDLFPFCHSFFVYSSFRCTRRHTISNFDHSGSSPWVSSARRRRTPAPTPMPKMVPKCLTPIP